MSLSDRDSRVSAWSMEESERSAWSMDEEDEGAPLVQRQRTDDGSSPRFSVRERTDSAWSMDDDELRQGADEIGGDPSQVHGAPSQVHGAKGCTRSFSVRERVGRARCSNFLLSTDEPVDSSSSSRPATRAGAVAHLSQSQDLAQHNSLQGPSRRRDASGTTGPKRREEKARGAESKVAGLVASRI